MSKRTLSSMLALTVAMALNGCGNDSSSDNEQQPPQNQAPVAVNDSMSAYPGDTVLMDVLTNDIDPDGDALTIVSSDLEWNEHGQLIYQVAEDAAPGQMDFSYTISDNTLESTATASLIILEQEPITPPLNRGEYAGSESCKTCHSKAYQQWESTKHARVMRKLYTDEGHTIGAPWGTEAEPREFSDVNGNRYTAFMKGNKYWVTTHDAVDSANDLSYQIDAVAYTNEVIFMTYEEDKDRLTILPFIYWPNEEHETWTLFTGDSWFNPMDGSIIEPNKFEVIREYVAFSNRCAECHATDFEISNWRTGMMGTITVNESNLWTSKEWGIGCEKCHGPGAEHTRTMDAGDIVTPTDLVGEKKNSACGSCHQMLSPDNNTRHLVFPYKFNVANEFDKGQHFNVGDNPSDFWTNWESSTWLGTDVVFGVKSDYTELANSKHGQANLDCADCHSPHDQGQKREGDAVCLSCHSDKTEGAHGFSMHSMADVGCIDCHMPYVKMSTGRGLRYDGRTHRFDVITPTDSLANFDALAGYTESGADPEHDLTKAWQFIDSLGGACYEDWKFPPHLNKCVKFDVLPNACSSCHVDDHPAPGVFTNEERYKLLQQQERYQRFLALDQ